MQPNRYYMHKKAMDICLRAGYVSLETYPLINKDADARIITGAWYNLGYSGKPWYIDDSQLINITVADASQWVDITDFIKNVRVRPGLPV